MITQEVPSGQGQQLKNVWIQAGIQAILEPFIRQKNYTRIAVLVDEQTKKHCYPLLKAFLPKPLLISIRSGEEQKTLETCTRIWQQLTEAGFDRKSLLINLGGGVIGDMGGFCAATYKRGIDFIQVPTTLLSQVDASVGGKLGIDFNGFKNHIGVFREPAAVMVATDFLRTLPHREIRSGFAEIIKHCLIADAAMWAKIRKRDLDQQKWEELVPHSIQIKQAVVAQDPTEKGLRKILNFGHTIGHAVESCFLTQPRRKLLHGEAIAAGMICESYLSFRKGLLSEAELLQIEEYVYSVYGKVAIKDSDIEAILPYVLQDKKNQRGNILCVLLEKIGSPVYDQRITLKEITEALHFYRGEK
jgi:3-dehydroquinate synthase